MARRYRRTRWRRLVDALVRMFLVLGIPIPQTYLLTVRGRRTGRLHTVPVTLVQRGSHRWLVSPYGEVDWVRNARAAGHVTLRRGRWSETVAVVPSPPEEAAVVLREYVRRIPVVRPYFDARPHDSLDAFLAEVDHHPVFRIVPDKPTPIGERPSGGNIGSPGR